MEHEYLRLISSPFNLWKKKHKLQSKDQSQRHLMLFSELHSAQQEAGLADFQKSFTTQRFL